MNLNNFRKVLEQYPDYFVGFKHELKVFNVTYSSEINEEFIRFITNDEVVINIILKIDNGKYFLNIDNITSKRKPILAKEVLKMTDEQINKYLIYNSITEIDENFEVHENFILMRGIFCRQKD